jgi:predicted Zn-dependent protease
VDRLRPVVGGLSVEDRRYPHLDDASRKEVLELAVRSVKAESKTLVPGRFTYRDRATQRRFANSRGVSLEERSTRYDAQGEVRAGDLHLTESIASRSFASIASLPFGTSLARRAVALLLEGDTLDGEVPVMMPPHVVAELVAFLGPYFVPERLTGAEPFFLAAKGEEPVVDTRLHILDDGRIPGGLHTRSFDDRGVVPVPLTLLKEGVPDGAYRGPEAARRDGRTPTGHEMGGVQVPGNLALRSGTKTVNHTWTDFADWSLRLDSLDPSSLDLGTGVLETPVNGLVMHSNQPKGAVRNRMARLDLAKMFNAVREVCSDTDRVGHVDAPALFLDGLVLR